MAVTGDRIVPLTANSILDRASEYDIYRYYLGIDFSLGRATYSPFRKEHNPSFSINISKSGRLNHLDFADNQKSGDCFDFVMQLYWLSYGDALKKIDTDLGLGITNGKAVFTETRRQDPRVRVPKLFQVRVRPFTSLDIEYWKLYGISVEELKANNVYSVEKLWIDKKVYSLSEDSPTFGYFFSPKWKIYRPLASDKWLSNVSGDTMSGLHRIVQGCDTVVVTKSKKDEILLSKFLPYVCSVQQENTIAISSSNISLLSGICNKVLLNFDSDKVGVQSCKYYNQFGFGWINCPKGYTDPSGSMIKDFSDLARYFGIDEVKKHFKLKGII